MTELTEFHSKFPGGVSWRVGPRGVEIQGAGLVPVTAPYLKRTQEYVDRYKPFFLAAAAEYGVPAEILIACSLTESRTDDPKTPIHENELCCREEPGYVSDEATPHRVSSGLCQLLISTARATMKNPKIDRAWLQVPENAIRACASYMKDLNKSWKTGYDPVYSACAYNAGGLYENKGAANRWRLRQYPIGTSKHADRFVEYFNAAVRLAAGPEWDAVGFRKLLA